MNSELEVAKMSEFCFGDKIIFEGKECILNQDIFYAISIDPRYNNKPLSAVLTKIE